VANALDRWDKEGGAPVVSWPLPYEPSDLLDVERRVLECLGAALSQRNGMICLLALLFRQSNIMNRLRNY
jgi:hypothetical protein